MSKPDPWGEKGTVYLLHFDPAYRHARHYLGWTSNLDDRLARHRGERERDGRGSRLVEVAVAAGSKLIVTRTWSGDRHFERHVKGRGLAAYCPMCCELAGTKTRDPVGGGVETFRVSLCPECGSPDYNGTETVCKACSVRAYREAFR